MASEFEVLKVDSEYEIETEFPHRIRKISTGRVVTVGDDGKGYSRVVLNRQNYQLHRLIALQFIPNDDPIGKPFVDHINRTPSDYRIENLRWVSRSENNRNKSSNHGIIYEFVQLDEVDDDDLIVINEYGKHEFEDLYYDDINDRFLLDNDVNYRVLYVNTSKSGTEFIRVKNTDGNRVKIFVNKFKRERGLM